MSLQSRTIALDEVEMDADADTESTNGQHKRLHHMNSNNERFSDSDESDLPRELLDLAKVITALPDEFQNELEPVYSRVLDSVKRRRRILSLVQEALAQLRLDIKYLMFDLEVTRKERDELRERLE